LPREPPDLGNAIALPGTDQSNSAPSVCEIRPVVLRRAQPRRQIANAQRSAQVRIRISNSWRHGRACHHALAETGKLSAVALFCVGTASAFGWMLAYYQIPRALLANVTTWGMGITEVGFFIA
jgi:hypothetical protein